MFDYYALPETLTELADFYSNLLSAAEDKLSEWADDWNAARCRFIATKLMGDDSAIEWARNYMDALEEVTAAAQRERNELRLVWKDTAHIRDAIERDTVADEVSVATISRPAEFPDDRTWLERVAATPSQ